MLILSLILLTTSDVEVTPRKTVEFFGRIEGAAAFPLSEPQTSRFHPGFNGVLNAGLDFGYVDLQLSTGMLALAGKATQSDSISGGVGGGVRFKLPYHLYKYAWFLAADAFYWRTATLNRVAYSVAVGVLTPLKVDPRVRIGPVVRFMQITNGDSPGYDDRNAYTLMAGIALEFGSEVPRRAP